MVKAGGEGGGDGGGGRNGAAKVAVMVAAVMVNIPLEVATDGDGGGEGGGGLVLGKNKAKVSLQVWRRGGRKEVDSAAGGAAAGLRSVSIPESTERASRPLCHRASAQCHTFPIPHIRCCHVTLAFLQSMFVVTMRYSCTILCRVLCTPRVKFIRLKRLRGARAALRREHGGERAFSYKAVHVLFFPSLNT